MQWNYAFDLGADKLRMVMRGVEGMFIDADREACRRVETVPFARGDKALEFESRNTGSIIIRRCAQSGLPVNDASAARWLRILIQLHERKLPGQKTVLTAVSPFMDDSRRSGFLKALLNEGFDSAGTVAGDICALIGAGADIAAPETQTVVDIGASSILCSCIAGGYRVKADRLNYGMDRVKSRIADNISNSRNVRIGSTEVDRLLTKLFESSDTHLSAAVLNTETGLPLSAEIHKSALLHVLEAFYSEIAELILNTINWLPEGCAADVLKNGVTLTGGGSLLFGTDRQLKNLTGLNIRTAPDADLCIINGLKKILENQDRYTLQISDWLETGMHA